MKKIFSKIIGIYLVVFIPLIILIVSLIFNIIRDHHIESKTSELEHINLLLQDQLRPLVVYGDNDSLQHVVKRTGKHISTRITVINRGGVVLADSDEDPAVMENHGARPEILEAYAGETGTSLRHSKTLDENFLYVALPLYYEGNFIAVIRTSLSVEQINELIADMRISIIEITAIAGFIAILILLIFSKNLTRPVRDLAEASGKVAKGDFNTKVIVKNKDEIGQLADSFNQMTERITTMFKRQKMQQDELKSILSSMQEALVVIDDNDIILTYNDSFEKLAGEEVPEDKPYWEVLRDIKIQNIVKKVRKKQKNKTLEVQIGEDFYLCSANFVKTKEEIVLVFFDISERKKLEEMKKDFIVNISHELKTPLTAIKGFVETMEDEDGGEYKRYLEIIKRHTQRLIAIVEDLLTISSLENKNVKLELDRVDFNELIDNIQKLFEERLKEKELTLKADIQDDLPDYNGDFFKLEQLFINLIDNVVKYTSEGTIDVKINELDENIRIEVIDTGPGIPKTDLSRIFERFYTVDKSRSRKNGGTGLGLSIVKHIVQLHRGTISVDSSIGIGTKFIIDLPLHPVVE